MTTEQLQAFLVEVLDEAFIEGDGMEQMRVTTYEDAGVLTYDKGLVITTEAGEEFQLTLIQSK